MEKQFTEIVADVWESVHDDAVEKWTDKNGDKIECHSYFVDNSRTISIDGVQFCHIDPSLPEITLLVDSRKDIPLYSVYAEIILRTAFDNGFSLHIA